MSPRQAPLLEQSDLLRASGYRIRYHPRGASQQLFSCRGDEVLLAGPAGCLAGWTDVVYNRGLRNSGRSIKLSELHLKLNGLPSSNPPAWDLTIPTYLHSLGDDSVMFYNRVVAVYESGVKPLVCVNFVNGIPIHATSDHPFMTEHGWVNAGDLRGGAKVTSRGLMTARSSGGKDLSARPPRVIVNCKYHPFGAMKSVSGYFYTRVPRSRLVVEADLNQLPYDEFVHILKHCPELAEQLRYVPTDFEVHHCDEDTLNDDLGNLAVLSRAEHARIHNQKANFRFASTSEVIVSSVVEDGEDMTYDVQMEAPANNFCGNGVVLHNTGKSLSALHKLHLAMSKYPNAKAFMARKTRTSMTNSCLDTFDRHVLRPPDKVHFHKQDQQYNYPNGSIIAVIGLDDPERIKSTDWDMGFVQEVTECTENDWEIATTRLRNWVMPYQQMIADCNPDKPTHWIKKRCDAGLTTLLRSVHKDNPRLWAESTQEWTPEGLQYLAKLERLSGVRRKRLYEGEWVAAEGIVYEMWDDNVHLINYAQLPEGWQEWTHYWSIDWGYTHPFCFDDQTDVLTRRGWSRFAHLQDGEEVATISAETHELEWQVPLGYVEYHYSGDMVVSDSVKGGANFSVTPDHDMVVRGRRTGLWSKQRASDLRAGWVIPTSWMPIEDGDAEEVFEVPRGVSQRSYLRKSLATTRGAFSEFLGLFIAEGYLSRGSGKYVRITQSKHKSDVRRILGQTGWSWSETTNHLTGCADFSIGSADLFDFLSDVGLRVRSRYKRIPPFILDWGASCLRLLLNGLIVGDGSPLTRELSGWKGRRYHTTSEGLADDVQALACLLGLPTSKTKQRRSGGYANPTTEFCYCVYFKQTHGPDVGSLEIRREKYSGYVYCVTVPNGTLVVRRGGKPMICGNCWQDWVEDPFTLALYRVREIYRTRTIVEDHAREIMDLTGNLYQPRAIICDHDAGDRATFERHTGYLTLPAYKSIQQGVQAVSARLRPSWGAEKPERRPGPGLFLVRDALVSVDKDLQTAGKPTRTEEEWDGYVWDEKVNRLTNSKKDELPLDKDNHGVDAVRYMIAFADSLAEDPEDIEGVLFYDEGAVRISPL